MSKLNIDAVNEALNDKGLSQAGLAQAMRVSRESVSKWLRGEAVPRPAKLLKLALLLGLSRAKLLGEEHDNLRPQVAFRMARNKTARDEHHERAEHMGKMLEALVPYLPFDKFASPPTLKSPSPDFDYLQGLVQSLRKELGVTPSGVINIPVLASYFAKLQAVIVPVLWGHRTQHENAVHIYLPKTATTWVYLNLDTRLCDLKFWLAHELGHTLTFATLKGEEGEDFADRFAGALLLPEAAAKPLYAELEREPVMRRRISRVKEVAEELEISMVGVAKQLDQYAVARGLQPLIDEAPLLYQTNEKSRPPTASNALFGTGDVELRKLINASSDVFHTPFFSTLQDFLRETGRDAGYVQGILDCSLVDAKQVVHELA